MRSDDELLSHIRQQAGVRRQRRQRAVVGAAAAAVVLLLGVGALAATGGEESDSVQADDGGSTTTAAPTTTEATTTTDSPTSTTSPTTTTTTTTPPATEPTPTEPTTTTEVPTTTEPPGIEPVSQTATGDGITLTVTAAQDPARPGWVDVTIRIEDDYGSGASGAIDWGQGDEPETAFGPWAIYYPTSCDELIDDDPTTDTAPDTHAGPVDDTFTLSHQYLGGPGDVEVAVHVFTSFCTTESAGTELTLIVPRAG